MKKRLPGKDILKKALTRFALMAVASLCCIQGANAQTVPIGNNTGTSNYYPLYNYYGYSYSQTIYLASEINAGGASGPSYITAIKYFYAAAGTPTANWAQWDIQMANVPQASFTDNAAWVSSGLQTVFSGSISVPATAGQWMTIPLSTPFLWDGTSNLVIGIDENSPGYASPYSSWQITTLGLPDLRTLLYYDDNTNPSPAAPPSANQSENVIPDIRLVMYSNTPCAGVPPTSTAMASYNNVCSGTAIDLDLPGFTPAAGETFQWQSSPNGSTWSNIGSSQTSSFYTVNSQNATTYYRCVVTCTNSGLSANSSPVTVTQTPFTSCYCTPAPSSSCGNGDAISNLQFGLTNDYPVCNGTGYTDQTAVPASSLTAGAAAYPVFATIGNSTYGNAYVGLWIDYDHSGTFDAAEYTPIGVGTNTTLSGALAVPFYAVGGLTHMRVMLQSSYSPITNPDPCNLGSGYGETVDYKIYITPATGCSGVPAGGSAQASQSAVCPNTAITLTLTGVGAVSNISYQWQSSPNGTTWTNLGAPQTSIPYTVASQTATTHYRCVLTCTPSAQSANSNQVIVTENAPTACYCTPSNFNCYNEQIGNVTFQSINDNPVCPGSNNGYIDQTGAISPPTISANQTYSLMLAVTTNSPGLQNAAGVWLDYNANGIFDTSEYTQIGNSAPSYTISLSIPFTAVGGLTRMRVVLDAGFSPINTQDPCNASGSTGMVVDYLVNITPVPACAGTPTAGTTTANAASVCPGTAVDLDLTGNSIVTGIQYQWQSSPNSSTWSNLGAPQITPPYEVTSQGVSTYYRCVLTCTNSAMTATSVPALVSQNSPTVCYCVNPATDCTEDDKLITVILATMTNTSSTCSPDGYSDYTATVPAATVQAGMSYTLTTETAYTSNEDVSVWIDYNHDGVFNNNEYNFIGTSNGTDDTIRNTITIPVTALTGVARMRVRVFYGTVLDSADACNNPGGSGLKTSSNLLVTNGYGETEDYLVNITPADCNQLGLNSGMPVTGPSTVCASSTMVLDLASPLPQATGLTYQWQFSPTGLGYNDIGSPIATSSIAISPPQTGYYHCVILCNTYPAATSGTLFVTAVSPTATAMASSTMTCAGDTITLTATGGVSYLWSTGANTASTTASPSANHVYSVTVTGANGCSALATVSVNVNPSTAISGSVTAASGNVAGKVILYQYKPFLVKFDSVAYTNIQANGSYNFPSVNSATFIVKAVPSASSLQITYAPNAISWQGAAPFTHGCAVSSITNIQVQTYTTLAVGTGSLSGRIYGGPGYIHKGPGLKPEAPGNPIPGVVVKGGKNPGAAIFGQTVTDATGNYSFASLPLNTGDDFFILVDIPGLDTNTTYHKQLTATVNSYDSLNFLVDGQYVTPIMGGVTSINTLHIADNNIRVFPNPANTYFTVSYSLLKQSGVKIELLDVVGKNIKHVQPLVSQAEGDYSTSVPVDQLAEGMYFIKISVDGHEAVIKLCITN